MAAPTSLSAGSNRPWIGEPVRRGPVDLIHGLSNFATASYEDAADILVSNTLGIKNSSKFQIDAISDAKPNDDLHCMRAYAQHFTAKFGGHYNRSISFHFHLETKDIEFLELENAAHISLFQLGPDHFVITQTVKLSRFLTSIIIADRVWDESKVSTILLPVLPHPHVRIVKASEWLASIAQTQKTQDVDQPVDRVLLKALYLGQIACMTAAQIGDFCIDSDGFSHNKQVNPSCVFRFTRDVNGNYLVQLKSIP